MKQKNQFPLLMVGALGIVYGDIGTSPLYTIRECFNPVHGIQPLRENVLGILSMIFWTLTLIVSIKYVVFIMRADNQGEGGILSLLALFPASLANSRKKSIRIIILAGIFGAALLLSDGFITPAITVLSAVEGLSMAAPIFNPVIVPLSVAILFVLFLAQKKGTGAIGSWFGPLMILWFLTIAVLGFKALLKAPSVIAGVNPAYGLLFLLNNPRKAFVILGSVLLCVTGAEALYADMGHFGRKAIRRGWFILVFPSLLINYFGQGAVILIKGEAAVVNPFYSLVDNPLWIYPLVVLSTLAGVIASQALISGAFSLAKQAVQLGYIPRLNIRHTSWTVYGQIYIPEINRLLMIACILLVLIFKNSSGLASAYGVAVMGTMCITSILFFFVTWYCWKWKRWKSVFLLIVFMILDVSFLSSSLLKIPSGGWIPLFMATIMLIIMITWKKGRDLLARSQTEFMLPLSNVVNEIEHGLYKPVRVKGSAVFMTANADIAPRILLHHLKHNRSLHEKVVILSILNENVPTVSRKRRLSMKPLSKTIFQVIARFGYMEDIKMQKIFDSLNQSGMKVSMGQISFYLGRTSLVYSAKGLNQWRKALFAFLLRNSVSPTSYYKIPPGQVIELGQQIEI